MFGTPLQACDTKMALDFIQQVMAEAVMYAFLPHCISKIESDDGFSFFVLDISCKFYVAFLFTRLQIEREKLFIDLSRVLAAAMRWEERAADILIHKAQMSEFEDIIRFEHSVSYFLFCNVSLFLFTV